MGFGSVFEYSSNNYASQQHSTTAHVSFQDKILKVQAQELNYSDMPCALIV